MLRTLFRKSQKQTRRQALAWRTPLTLESLEERCLLDAAVVTPALMTPSRFASEADFRTYIADQAVNSYRGELGQVVPKVTYTPSYTPYQGDWSTEAVNLRISTGAVQTAAFNATAT